MLAAFGGVHGVFFVLKDHFSLLFMGSLPDEPEIVLGDSTSLALLTTADIFTGCMRLDKQPAQLFRLRAYLPASFSHSVTPFFLHVSWFLRIDLGQDDPLPTVLETSSQLPFAS